MSIEFPPEMDTTFQYPLESSTYAMSDGTAYEVPCFVSAKVEAEKIVCPVSHAYSLMFLRESLPMIFIFGTVSVCFSRQ
jgi:hypothetical protein